MNELHGILDREIVACLVAVEAIDLLWRQDFLEPSLKDLGSGDWPIRALHVSPGPVARHSPNPQVDIGMAGIMGDSNGVLEAWRAICSGLGRRVVNLPNSFWATGGGWARREAGGDTG